MPKPCMEDESVESEIRAAIRRAHQPVAIQVPRWMLSGLAELVELKVRRLESQSGRCHEPRSSSLRGTAAEWAELSTLIRRADS